MGSRLARSTPVRLAIFALLATVLVWSSLHDAARLNEFRDAQVLQLYEHSAVDTIHRFGQLPFWNPYYCGGLDAVGAPQSRFTSPTLLLSLALGPERAEIVVVFLFAIVGMEGVYRWLRLRVFEPGAALLVAPVFALSGHFSVAYFRGWTNFFSFELVPWILLGVTLAARGRVAGIALCSIAFAVMLGFGGTFAAPLVAVAAVIEGTRALIEQPRPSRWRSLAMLATAASFMVTVALVRLWPIGETLAAAPRIMAGPPGHQPKAILAAIIGELIPKDGDIDLRGSFFIGASFLAVAALGGSERRALRAIFIVVVFVWLSAGYARKPALFALLRELPVFSALRYPERFLWMAVLFVCEPAAHALARVPLLGEGKKWRIGVWLVLGGAIAWTVYGQIRAFERVAAARVLGTVTETRTADFHQGRGNRWLATHYQALGIGSLACWETHPVAMSPLLRADLPAEEYLSTSTRDAGTVKRISWSPNKIVVHTALTRHARLLVNQNWNPGWHASTGTVLSNDGLLAIDLPAGEQDVTLQFRPWSTIAGAGVTLLSLVMLGVLARRARKRGALFAPASRVGTAMCVLLPWLALSTAYALSPDPRWPPPTLRNPNGSPALVEVEAEQQLPATPLGAEFDLPLRIEAGRLVGPDPIDNLTIDVYLRRTGTLPRATTMFVHVERRAGQAVAAKDKETFFNLDHQVIAGSFYLSDTPQGRIAHDAFGLHLKDAAGGIWDVWVGFGHVSGQRGRAKVTAPGKAEISDHRVRVASFLVE
jgi:hypothetical protein